MPLFALPLALFALSALPALAAVYFLRSRHRRREVSSLLLWPKEALPKGGGRKASRFRSSWLLLLELLILTLLALAAAGPVVGAAAGRRQVCVVLDDAVSMRAHDAAGQSARARAKRALLDEMEKSGRFEAQVVVAGPQPRLLGSAASIEALSQLLGEPSGPQAHWACLAEAADIPGALALAGQIAPAGAVTLVLSDRGAPADLPAGARWLAVGRPLPNVGITAAARSDDGAHGRMLLEVSNFSAVSTRAQVAVEMADGRGGWLKVAGDAADLPAGGRATLGFKNLPNQPLRARLAAPDALDEDNAVTLLPQPARVLPVRLAVADKALHQSLARALKAVGAKEVGRGEHLLISDAPAPAAPAAEGRPAHALAPRIGVWEWRIQDGAIEAADAGATAPPEGVVGLDAAAAPAATAPAPAKPGVRAFAGPYILNHTHPLTRGLSLQGVVWGMPGDGVALGAGDEEIIGLGDRPLLVDRLFPSGEHRIACALAPSVSTLAQTPAFPVLVANLVDWRLDHEPGLRRTNWRQGELAQVAVPFGVSQWELTAPDGEKTPWSGGPVIAVPAPQAGVYQFGSPSRPEPWLFRVNLCNADVSDLRLAAAGAAGAWPSAVGLEGRFKAAFILILLALALLAWHGHLARKGVEG